MRTRRGLVIVVVVVLLLLVCGIGALIALGSGPLGGAPGAISFEEVTEPAPATPPPMITVIVAARDIPRGASVSVQDVSTIGWPVLAEMPVPAGTLIVSPEEGLGLEQVEGRIARTDILRGQPILDFMLTPGSEPVGLADLGSDAALLIPSGQVAIAMSIDRLSSVAYALKEGDHVDILASFRFIDVDEEFQTRLPNNGRVLTDDAELVSLGFGLLEVTQGRQEEGPFGTTILIIPGEAEQTQRPRQVTQLVISNALVLRVGQWPVDDLNTPIVVAPGAAPQPAPAEGEQGAAASAEATPLPTAIPLPEVITLIVSRQDALVLKYALETNAQIDLALRTVLDNEVTETTTDSVTLQYLIDFYNVAIPPRLPAAQDPRIDQNESGAAAESEPSAQPTETDPGASE